MTEIRLPVGVSRTKSSPKYQYWRFRLRAHDGSDMVSYQHADYERVISFAEKWYLENRGAVEYRDD